MQLPPPPLIDFVMGFASNAVAMHLPRIYNAFVILLLCSRHAFAQYLKSSVTKAWATLETPYSLPQLAQISEKVQQAVGCHVDEPEV